MSQRVVVEADGGSRGNPGPAGYGAVVFDAATGEVLAERSDQLGVTTNNVAEYRGLIAGLGAAAELGAREVAVRMDSKLVVEQMSVRWQVKNEAMRELAGTARDLQRSFDEVTFEWIPREKNTYADRLANEAMDRAAGKVSRPPPAAAAAGGTVTHAGAGSKSAWVPPSGAPTRLILMRHGATAHSADWRFSGRNELPLDDVGERQAAGLARRAVAYLPLAAVVSSPLRRARQTAASVGESVGIDPVVDEGFAELDFGAWEGLTFAEANDRYAAELIAWRDSADVPPPQGESLNALARRVRRARDAVITGYPGESVIVVSHVTPIKTLVRLALDAPPSSAFRMHLDTASVSVIDYFADGAVSLRLFNDTGHLD